MATGSLDDREWQEYRRKMRQLLTADQRDIMHETAQQVGKAFDKYVRAQLPPPVRRLAAAPYWTARQRKWWWATMHKKALGESDALPGWKATYKTVDGRKTLVISGGYRRGGELAKSLSYRLYATATMAAVFYGTVIPYAKYVLDEEDQSKYHAGNWPILQELHRQFEESALRIAQTTMMTEIDKRL